eukprot:CAMPEP_0116038040 /NCGR_PEP_ID=MMETSP0321-20121206/22500_1 /TAXON_ID=163516 /ORGANISM="Leptocylindrus danicus var. danicus, Strain B650" /LENGTH=191 /DNA_ID=CAMNT_0003516535 /DNA_START=261 /DNA_END=836 /DNA_ORIENTATION=+
MGKHSVAWNQHDEVQAMASHGRGQMISDHLSDIPSSINLTKTHDSGLAINRRISHTVPKSKSSFMTPLINTGRPDDIMELQLLLEQGMHYLTKIENKIATMKHDTEKESENDDIAGKEKLLEALAKARDADMKHGLCSEPSRAAWELVDNLYKMKSTVAKSCASDNESQLKIKAARACFEELLSDISARSW